MACAPRSSPCAKKTCSCSTTSSRRAATRPSRRSLASSLVWSSRATTRWCWFRNRARTRRRRRRRPPPRRRHVRPGGSGGIIFLASAESTVRRALAAAAARRPELFAPGTRLVVGFSGGQDSSCLLHALSRPRMRLVVVAAHVDHALRLDSAEAAAGVKEAAAAIRVACEVRRVEVPAYRAGLPAWGVQQAARAARYHTLAGLTREHDPAALVVAHTADDQAETVLLNLLRGSGLAGLGGMPLDELLDPGRLGPPPEPIYADAHRVRLARPLLSVSRATTLAYCAEAGLTVIEDASNQSRDFARNRVRLDLLPALEGYNPAIRDVLARTADLVAEDLAALEAVIEGLYAGVVWRGSYRDEEGHGSAASGANRDEWSQGSAASGTNRG